MATFEQWNEGGRRLRVHRQQRVATLSSTQRMRKLRTCVAAWRIAILQRHGTRLQVHRTALERAEVAAQQREAQLAAVSTSLAQLKAQRADRLDRISHSVGAHCDDVRRRRGFTAWVAVLARAYEADRREAERTEAAAARRQAAVRHIVRLSRRAVASCGMRHWLRNAVEAKRERVATVAEETRRASVVVARESWAEQWDRVSSPIAVRAYVARAMAQSIVHTAAREARARAATQLQPITLEASVLAAASALASIARRASIEGPNGAAAAAAAQLEELACRAAAALRPAVKEAAEEEEVEVVACSARKEAAAVAKHAAEEAAAEEANAKVEEPWWAPQLLDIVARSQRRSTRRAFGVLRRRVLAMRHAQQLLAMRDAYEELRQASVLAIQASVAASRRLRSPPAPRHSPPPPASEQQPPLRASSPTPPHTSATKVVALHDVVKERESTPMSGRATWLTQQQTRRHHQRTPNLFLSGSPIAGDASAATRFREWRSRAQVKELE